MQNEVTIKVTIWNEGRHEKIHPNVGAIYPSGIHGAMAAGLKNEGFAIRCGSLDDPDDLRHRDPAARILCRVANSVYYIDIFCFGQPKISVAELATVRQLQD